jgi:hypothetical protein
VETRLNVDDRPSSATGPASWVAQCPLDYVVVAFDGEHRNVSGVIGHYQTPAQADRVAGTLRLGDYAVAPAFDPPDRGDD